MHLEPTAGHLKGKHGTQRMIVIIIKGVSRISHTLYIKQNSKVKFLKPEQEESILIKETDGIKNGSSVNIE